MPSSASITTASLLGKAKSSCHDVMSSLGKGPRNLSSRERGSSPSWSSGGGENDLHRRAAFGEMTRNDKPVAAVVALADEDEIFPCLRIESHDPARHRFAGGLHQRPRGDAGAKNLFFARDHFLEGEDIHKTIYHARSFRATPGF